MKTWKAAINVQVFVTNVKLRKIKFLLRIRRKPVNYSELAGRGLKVHTDISVPFVKGQWDISGRADIDKDTTLGTEANLVGKAGENASNPSFNA